ncbi:MAG: DUF6603 domain-containing protein [Saprospiraceae bacterium]
MAAQGTLESIALELAGLFKPLEEEFQAGRIRTLFAELGMEFPPELETKTAFINALKQTVNKTLQLPGIVIDLVQAIEDENFGQITSKGVDLFGTIKSLVENIKLVADELSSIGGALPGISATELNAFAADLPRNILDYLIVKNMEGTPGMAEAFEFINGIERETITNGDFTYTTRKIKIDKLTDFISNPEQELGTLYDWGKNSFTGVKLLQTLEKLLTRSGVPAIFDNSGPTPVLDAIFLEIKPKTDINPKGLEISLLTKVDVESDGFSLDDWKIRFALNTNLEGGVKIILQPDGNFIFVPPSGSLQGEGFLEWIAGNLAGNPYLLLGQANGSRLEARELALRGGVGFAWDSQAKQASGNFTIGGEVKGGKLFVDFSQGDGFLSKILSSIKLESDFDIGFGFSSKNGLFFYGSSTLLIQLPMHTSLGPIDLSALTIGIGIENGKIPLSLALDIKAALGPLNALVEQIGMKANMSFPSNQNGNLGPVDLSLGFKPPNGLGLSIDAGVIKGGGYLYFDHDREEYAGALELVFSEWIALKAIGLITTRLPDGSKGFSMLIIITVEFGSGIQLGFGFTLLGVGGLLGLNRTVNIQPLAEGVRTGAVENVMFPQDVIANAPRIISDLRQFFPAANEGFLIGPMAKIGWGTPTLVSVSLGIILEFPDFAITILGVIKVNLPTEDAAVLKLQVNFIGRIEPSNSLLWFYAQLYDSRILFITLEGGIGLLVNWGSNSNFVFSVGGFHPQYTPPPLPFPPIPRLAINILNESFAKIRIEGYFAVTSNTVQFGARVELFFGVSAFNIDGHFGFDALFQFNPFYFSFSLSVSLSVKLFGFGLFSIGFSGLLEGPTPWHIKGHGSIGFLFFSISVPFEHTWGEERQTILPPIEVFPLVEKEFATLANWEAVVPKGSSILVTLRQLGSGQSDELVLHPVGTLRISQRKLPLKLKLEKFGNQRPNDANKFSISAGITGGDSLAVSDTKEKFATGEFRNLNNSQKLSSPGFDLYESGIEIKPEGEQLKTSMGVKRIIRYETIIIDNNFKRHLVKFYSVLHLAFAAVYANLFTHFLKGASVTKSTLSQHYKKQIQPNETVIKVVPNQFTVAFNDSNKPVDAAATQFTSQASAMDFMKEQIELNPAAASRLHVIPNTEVNAA